MAPSIFCDHHLRVLLDVSQIQPDGFETLCLVQLGYETEMGLTAGLTKTCITIYNNGE